MAANGMLDKATLVDVTGAGDYLTPDAARDFIALRNYVRERFGVTLGVTELYRDRAAQDEVWRLYLAGDPRVPYPPAPKYTSGHGWANRADISGYSLVPDFDAVLAMFGWVRDVPGEPWHMTHVRTVTAAGAAATLFTTATIGEDPDMQYAIKNTIISKPDPLNGKLPLGAILIGQGTDPLIWVENPGPELERLKLVPVEWDTKTIHKRIGECGLRGSGAELDRIYYDFGAGLFIPR